MFDLTKLFSKKGAAEAFEHASRGFIETEQKYLGGAAKKFRGNLPKGVEFNQFETALKGGIDEFDTFVNAQREGNQGVLRNIGDELLGTAEKPAPRYTPETLDRMSTSLSNTGEIGRGITQRDTVGTNPLLRVLGSSEGYGGAAAAIGIGAGLGAGAAALTGNDKGSGAIAGGLGVIGMRGLSKAVSDNIGGIENFMMKKVLGEEELFVPSKVQQSIREGNVTDQQIASLRSHMQDMGYKPRAQQTAENQARKGSDYFMHQGMGRTVKKMTDEAARRNQLENISRMETGNMSAVQRGMHGMLTKNKGIGMQTRYLVGSGAMLSGVAFSSPRKDRSRGFNRNRGNRF